MIFLWGKILFKPSTGWERTVLVGKPELLGSKFKQFSRMDLANTQKNVCFREITLEH